MLGGEQEEVAGRRAVDRRVEQLGDAEVEQPDVAFAGDQDVGRLEVAMHHQVGVGKLNRFAHREEKAESLREVEVPIVGVAGQRGAGHVLHHQIGLSLVGYSPVQQRGDVGMLEPGQDLSLGSEAAEQVLGVPPGPHQLDGHLLFVLGIGPPSPIDLAHAPAANDRVDGVGADPGAGRKGADPLDGGRTEEPIGVARAARGQVARQDGVDLPAEVGVVATRLVEVGGALGRVEFQGVEEDLLQSIPGVPVQRPRGFGVLGHWSTDLGHFGDHRQGPPWPDGAESPPNMAPSRSQTGHPVTPRRNPGRRAR